MKFLKKIFPVNYIILIWLVSAISACGEIGKRPFVQIQLCLENETGISKFKGILKEFATAEGMTYIDNSTNAQRNLEIIADGRNTRGVKVQIIHIDVHGDDGFGLMAGNSGLTDYEVAIGFSEGRNPAAAHKFSRNVIEALGEHWVIEFVPDGQGAFPLKNYCGNSDGDSK